MQYMMHVALPEGIETTSVIIN